MSRFFTASYSIDRGISTVSSGVEDYGTAMRRVMREAGAEGLRVRYASGHTRRLDSAARMNLLDGIRKLNQSCMMQVGQQFGADGIEIDAHMLCAEDHLPYQGGQYSNAEFGEIQDSLDRPFGEWNCRHTWHPILMGISPKTYTDEQLGKMRRYSTEEVTIDGRTKTRYAWSQEMRRIETEVRKQKDTANLARESGDDKLQRECQGKILALNERYRDVARASGLKAEFGRTYVGGFRDVGLTGGTTGDMMVADVSKVWYTITPESIRSVPEFTEFETPNLNEAVHKACVEILTDMMDKPLGTEEAISIPIAKAEEFARGRLNIEVLKNVGEDGDGAVRMMALKEPYIAVHNHPSCKTFSYRDIQLYWNDDNFKAAIVVGNNGTNTYTLLKTEQFDFYGFAKYVLAQKNSLASYANEEEFLKGVGDYGVLYVKRNG